MKKIIAISVLFALLATAAFAETSVGGNMKLSTSILRGQSKSSPTDIDSTVKTGPVVFWDGHVNVNFGDAEGGGMLRLWTKTNEWQPDWFAFWWWRPVEYFRMQLGKDADAHWGTAQITGWGYNAEAQGGIALDQHRGLNGTAAIVARTSGFAPGVQGPGLSLSGYLLDTALQINVHIPFGGSGSLATGGGSPGSPSQWQEVYTKIYANVTYNLEGIGKLFLTAQFANGNQKRFNFIEDEINLADGKKPKFRWQGDNEVHDPFKLYASFYLTALDNMAVDIGFAYTLPYSTQKVEWVNGKKFDNVVDRKYGDISGDYGKATSKTWVTTAADTATDQTKAENGYYVGIINPAPNAFEDFLVNVGGYGYNDYAQNTRVMSPFEIGLGYRIGIGANFSLKLRTGFEIGGGAKRKDGAGADSEFWSYVNDFVNISNSPAAITAFNASRTVNDPNWVEKDFVNETLYGLIYGGASTGNKTYVEALQNIEKELLGTQYNLYSSSQTIEDGKIVNYEGTTDKITNDFVWGIGILPSYKVGKATVFFNAGLGVRKYGKVELKYAEIHTNKDGEAIYTNVANQRSVPVYKFANDAEGYDGYATVTNGGYTEDNWYPGRQGDQSYKSGYTGTSYEDRYGDIVIGTKTIVPKTRIVAKEKTLTSFTEFMKQENLDADGNWISGGKVDGLTAKTSEVDWFINPYVTIPAGSGRFYVGFKLWADGEKKPQKYTWNKGNVQNEMAGENTGRFTNSSVVKWEIPIGWNFYF